MDTKLLNEILKEMCQLDTISKNIDKKRNELKKRLLPYLMTLEVGEYPISEYARISIKNAYKSYDKERALKDGFDFGKYMNREKKAYIYTNWKCVPEGKDILTMSVKEVFEDALDYSRYEPIAKPKKTSESISKKVSKVDWDGLDDDLPF